MDQLPLSGQRRIECGCRSAPSSQENDGCAVGRPVVGDSVVGARVGLGLGRGVGLNVGALEVGALDGLGVGTRLAVGVRVGT